MAHKDRSKSEPLAEAPELRRRIEELEAAEADAGGGCAGSAFLESGRTWRSLAENAPNLIAVVDREGTMLYLNHAVSGFSVEETMATSVYEYMDPRFRDLARETIRRTFRTGEPGSYEAVGAGPDGRDSWYETRVGAIKRGGQLVAVTLISTDITDRRRVEEGLLRERDNLLRILDSMEDGVWIVGRGYEVEYVNPALWRELGPHEGGKCFEYFHGRTEACRECRNGAVLAGKTVRWERHFPKSRKTYDIVNTPLRNRDGSVSKLGILRDVTERRRAEETLRRSEAKYHALVENTNDVVFAVDAEGRLTYASPQIERFGVSQEEAVTRKAFALILPEDRERVARDLRRTMTTGEEFPTEFRMLDKDGRIRWLEDVSKVQRDESGKVVGLAGALRDITERKRVEEALRESERKYRELVENMSDVIYALDEKGVVTYASPAMESLLGYKPSEAVGRRFSEFVHPGDLPQAKRSIGDVLSGRPSASERRVLTKSGDVRWVRASSQPILEGGRVVGVRGILADVTEERQLEERIVEARAREQRRIGRDLHDGLGQELAGIAYVSKALEQKLADSRPEEAAEAAQIARLIDDAVAHTRNLEAVLNPVGLDAGGLVDALELMAANVSSSYGVSCEFDCGAEVRLHDEVAATHAYRIAQEAVNNAMRHGQAERITVELRTEDGLVVLVVKDDGAGLTKGWEQTEGIGLKTMQHRSRMLGGNIRVEAAPDGGTAVTCSFPQKSR